VSTFEYSKERERAQRLKEAQYMANKKLTREEVTKLVGELHKKLSPLVEDHPDLLKATVNALARAKVRATAEPKASEAKPKQAEITYVGDTIQVKLLHYFGGAFWPAKFGLDKINGVEDGTIEAPGKPHHGNVKYKSTFDRRLGANVLPKEKADEVEAFLKGFENASVTVNS